MLVIHYNEDQANASSQWGTWAWIYYGL